MHTDSHMQNSDISIKSSSKIEDKVVFFFVSMGIITITLGFFTMIDFLPEKPRVESTPALSTVDPARTNENTLPSTKEATSSEALPLKIIFDSLDKKEITVLNPTSNTVASLDEALLSGVVRHPDSADFVHTGTIFILGHSSYLPVVHNKNFQAFNGIQKLAWGDTIRLQSKDMEYVYRIDKVYEAKASNAEVPLQYDTAKLVLATCNSFGTKDDRYIVEASLIMKRGLSS